MYFASRLQAGRMLAARIVPKYSGIETVIVALDDGGVVVGHQIAKQLNCELLILENLPKDKLLNKNVILISQGLKESSQLDEANKVFEAHSVKKLIIATPLASQEAIHAMHTFVNEIILLTTVFDYDETNDYYDQYDVPEHNEISEFVEQFNLDIS
jgi:predicted phosphoribosyltransferase